MSDFENNESKFMRKAKENPFVPVGKYILCSSYIMGGKLARVPLETLGL